MYNEQSYGKFKLFKREMCVNIKLFLKGEKSCVKP